MKKAEQGQLDIKISDFGQMASGLHVDAGEAAELKLEPCPALLAGQHDNLHPCQGGIETNKRVQRCPQIPGCDPKVSQATITPKTEEMSLKAA